MKDLKKNDIFAADIDGYSSEGLGVCHIDGRGIFVPLTIVGERWEIKLVKVSSTACYGKAVKLLSPAPGRVEPVCPHFGKCGGCDTMHMSYENELRFKLCKVNDALERIGKQNVRSDKIIGGDNCLYYRNKAIYAVADKDGITAFGFYRERSHELIGIESCYIQNELSNRCAAAVTAFMDEHEILPYNEESCKGCVRHIFSRKAANTGEAVLCIVAARGFGGLTDLFVKAVLSKCPELTGIVLCINKTRGNSVLSGDFYTLWGKSDITDILCGFRFSIAPQAFFQINPPQAEKLYEKAMEYASGVKNDLAFDLYCGAGTISLCLARNFKRVIGAEIVPEAVKNATENAAENDVANAEFICSDAAQAALLLSTRGLKPDVIVVDPPRKGMDDDAVKACSDMSPERLVYVSCNPATLARDILRFNSYGYTLKEVTAVDMFPRTSHVETVVLLSKNTPNDHIEVDLNEPDAASAEAKATYGKIKE